MIKLPKMYTANSIKAMHEKLNLDAQTVMLLYDYFDAFSNFYEMLPLKDAYKIIKKQNDELKLTEEDFIAFSEIARHEEHFYFILGSEETDKNRKKSKPMERTIVNESLVLIDELFYKMMVASQKGKPLFVPEKNKLLRYVDDSFIEENEYTTALYDFFANNMKLGESDAWDTVGDCILEIKNGENPLEEVLSYLDYRKLLPEEKNLSELIGVISRLNNFTRTPVNRGFTPVELNQLGGGLSADSVVFEEDNLIPLAVLNSNGASSKQ
mgnify:FL=1